MLQRVLALAIMMVSIAQLGMYSTTSIPDWLLKAQKTVQGEKMKTIAIIGAGYVGLVTGACFATKGNKVVIIENNQQRIDALLQGKIPFYEPNLDTLVAQALSKKTISFVSTIKEGLAQNPDLIFSCVGTPPMADGSADLSFVDQAAREIGRNISNYVVVVNKSTVPVGTAARVRELINQEIALRNLAIPFDVASNPEFLKEGDAVKDFLIPDRVVIGVDSDRALKALQELYAPFLRSPEQLFHMNIESAELTKYAANAMLATRISFMNQLAHLADRVGADIKAVEKGMGADQRIGPMFLKAGIGYGGSCFPKDVKALVHMGSKYGMPMTLVQEVDAINDFQRLWFAQMINTYYGPALATKNVAVLGLAFKPETDDIRCAPAIDIIKFLLESGAQVIVYDPVAAKNMQQIFGDSIIYADSARVALAEADFAILMTEWNELRSLKASDFMLTKDKTLFDARNIYPADDFIKQGVSYFCVGRNSIKHEQNDTTNDFVTPARTGSVSASV